MSESEIWKDVVGYEGYYKVSNKGNVYSVERKNSRGIRCGGRILTPRPHRCGYLQVYLYKNGKMQTKLTHRLVAEAFITNSNNYPEVNHRDEDKTNNNVENLEWCTRKQNANHGTARKRAAKKTSKKVRAVNIKTGEILTFSSGVETGDRGFHVETVYLACKGVYKNNNGELIGDGHTYRGHRWSYE